MLKIKSILALSSMMASAISLNLIPVGQAQAVNLVQNGGFQGAFITSSNPGNTNGPVTTSAYLDSSVTLPGWSFATTTFDASGNKGYNFLVASGTQYKANLAANNPCNPPFSGTCGGTAGLFGATGQTVSAPGGSGWFIAADAYFERGAINQTLNNLTSGQQYVVSFYQASGQQNYLTNPAFSFTEHWDVSFGGVTKQATTMSAAALQPVSPWTKQSLTFTASAATQVLSFLAQSSNDVPPFALLSDVSVDALTVPEPETYVGTLVSLGLLGAVLKSRLAKKKLAEKD